MSSDIIEHLYSGYFNFFPCEIRVSSEIDSLDTRQAKVTIACFGFGLNSFLNK